MKKLLKIGLPILAVLLCGCSQKASTTKVSSSPNPAETTTDASSNISIVNTEDNGFNVDMKLDFGKTIPINSVYSKSVVVNVNNTGGNTITEIDLQVNGLDSSKWTCVGSSSDVFLNSGDATPYTITLSSRDPVAVGETLGFTITITAKAGIEVQHTLECYGEIVVSK